MATPPEVGQRDVVFAMIEALIIATSQLRWISIWK